MPWQVKDADLSPPAPLPARERILGSVEVKWDEVNPGVAFITTAGGCVDDRWLAYAVVREELNSVGIRIAQFSIDPPLIAHTTTQVLEPKNASIQLYDSIVANRKTAAWPDIMAKAKRLIQSGNVTLLRNGYNTVVAHVIGDHGEYQCEISRDDPTSRAITQWTCECPWDQFAFQRTREWKKYEGRPCAHVLAAYWKSLATPLDEDVAPGQEGRPGMPMAPGVPRSFSPVMQPGPSVMTPQQGIEQGYQPSLPMQGNPGGEAVPMPGQDQTFEGPYMQGMGMPPTSPMPMAPPPSMMPPLMAPPGESGIIPPQPMGMEQMQLPVSVPGGRPGPYPANPIQQPGTFSSVPLQSDANPSIINTNGRSQGTQSASRLRSGRASTRPSNGRVRGTARGYGLRESVVEQPPGGYETAPIGEPWFPTMQHAIGANKAGLAQFGQTNHQLLRPEVLEGALGRAQNYWHYEGDMHKAAAALAHGVGQAQAFEDGNKRTAYWLTHMFLHKNGYAHLAPNDDTELANHLIGYGEGTHGMADTVNMLHTRDPIEPGNPKNIPGTLARIYLVGGANDMFVQGMRARLNETTLGQSEGREGATDAGQWMEVPKNSMVEVRDQDKTTGWVEIIYPLKGGPMTSYHIRCFVEPEKLSPMGGPSPFQNPRQGHKTAYGYGENPPNEVQNYGNYNIVTHGSQMQPPFSSLPMIWDKATNTLHVGAHDGVRHSDIKEHITQDRYGNLMGYDGAIFPEEKSFQWYDTPPNREIANSALAQHMGYMPTDFNAEHKDLDADDIF